MLFFYCLLVAKVPHRVLLERATAAKYYITEMAAANPGALDELWKATCVRIQFMPYKDTFFYSAMNSFISSIVN